MELKECKLLEFIHKTVYCTGFVTQKNDDYMLLCAANPQHKVDQKETNRKVGD